jgi:hypothetical protein
MLSTVVKMLSTARAFGVTLHLDTGPVTGMTSRDLRSRLSRLMDYLDRERQPWASHLRKSLAQLLQYQSGHCALSEGQPAWQSASTHLLRIALAAFRPKAMQSSVTTSAGESSAKPIVLVMVIS